MRCEVAGREDRLVAEWDDLELMMLEHAASDGDLTTEGSGRAVVIRRWYCWLDTINCFCNSTFGGVTTRLVVVFTL
jgi:hypothetical protein